MSKEKVKSERYNLVLTGDVKAGVERLEAVKALAVLLKVQPQKANLLLGGKKTCIKKNLSKIEAQKYQKALTSIGVSLSFQKARNEPLVENKKKPEADIPAAASRSNSSPENAPANQPKKRGSDTDCTRGVTTLIDDQNVAMTIADTFEPESLSLFTFLFLFLTALFVAFVVVVYAGLGVSLAAFACVRLYTMVANIASLSAVDIVFWYLLPVGMISVFLGVYIRPVFPRLSFARPSGETVTESTQPKLFAFVRQLCDVLEISVPERLILTSNLEVKAQARYILSSEAKAKPGLCVSVGLPLFNILSTTQLAGMITNALWVYRHNHSRYFIYFINTVYQRLYDVVKSSDGWPQWLVAQQDAEKGLRETVFHSIAGGLIIISRYCSAVFFTLTSAVVVPLLRHLGAAADNCQTDLVGSAERAATYLTLTRAKHARSEVIKKMLNAPGVLRLVKDLPGLIAHSIDTQTVAVVKQLEDEMRQAEPSWYDAEIRIRDSIIKAEDRDVPSNIGAEFMPNALLQNYEAVSLEVSLHYYAGLQLYVNREELVENSLYTLSAEEELLREAKVQQYFNGWFQPSLFWRVPAPEKVQSLNSESKISLLNGAIKRLRFGTPEYLKIIADLPAINEKLRLLTMAYEIKKAGYGVPNEFFDPNQYANADFSVAFKSAKSELLSLVQRQQKYGEVMGLRILLAISSANIPEDIVLGRKLVDILRVIGQKVELLQKLKMSVSFLPVAMARMQNKKEPNHQRRIQKILRDVSSVCDGVVNSLRSLAWPLSDDYVTVADFVLANVKHQSPDTTDAASVLADKVEYYQRVVQGMEAANQTVNGQLAIIAARCEEKLGVEKIKVALVPKE